jgi:hypothetical protein
MKRLLTVAILALASPALAATAKIVGEGWQIPRTLGDSPPTYGSGLLDANGEKVAFIGRVFNKDGASKSINKVGIRWGTVTKGGSTDMQVSLQNLDAATPDADGMADQSALFGNGNIVANTWTVATLGSSRSVTYGEELAVVVEYSTFNASDAIRVGLLGNFVASDSFGTTYVRILSGAWSTINGYPLVILGFDDGTWGTLKGGVAWSAINTHTYNVDSATADEHMLSFQFPHPMTCGGAWVQVDGDGDFDLVVYDSGGNAVANASASIDKDHRDSVTSRYYTPTFSTHVNFSANTQYYLSVKPTTTTSLTTYSVDVADAGYWQAHGGGASLAYATRINGGAITAITTTRRLKAGLDDCMGFDDGVQTGGAPLIGPGGLIGD